jgi:hypothetical protein
MSDSYSIAVPFTQQELEEMLHEDKEFTWTFQTGEDKDMIVTLHLFKDYGEE